MGWEEAALRFFIVAFGPAASHISHSSIRRNRVEFFGKQELIVVVAVLAVAVLLVPMLVSKWNHAPARNRLPHWPLLLPTGTSDETGPRTGSRQAGSFCDDSGQTTLRDDL